MICFVLQRTSTSSKCPVCAKSNGPNKTGGVLRFTPVTKLVIFWFKYVSMEWLFLLIYVRQPSC